jgi:glycosyltransferase involved in cell wall biosynthesis
MIVYGGDLEPPRGTDTLSRLGLTAGEFLLYVSRFEPENNPDRVAEAYRSVPGSRPLAMVGGAPYAADLLQRVREIADNRVVLPGAIYGDGYRQLLFNCRAYIHATEVGGTHPALVEAMGAGRAVLYYDTPENREVAGSAGRPFRFEGDASLGSVLAELVENDRELRAMGERSRQRVEERYRWADVADAYEELLEGLC